MSFRPSILLAAAAMLVASACSDIAPSPTAAAPAGRSADLLSTVSITTNKDTGPTTASACRGIGIVATAHDDNATYYQWYVSNANGGISFTGDGTSEINFQMPSGTGSGSTVEVGLVTDNGSDYRYITVKTTNCFS